MNKHREYLCIVFPIDGNLVKVFGCTSELNILAWTANFEVGYDIALRTISYFLIILSRRNL